MHKYFYIFITGGVLSGLGKGICTSSIGKLLQWMGFNVEPIKIDGYFNFDAGTLRPTEHGEVWVTHDGGEIDQDLGHYERFLDINVSRYNNITSGQIYWQVIKNEREGKYLGQTVQLIPHVTDEIKRRIREIASKSNADFILVEIGGTVGDYENAVFIEAARQMKYDGENVLYIHLTYVPIPPHLGEAKTKPTQHSVKELREIGIQPDIIIARSPKPLDDIRKKKIAIFSNVGIDYVISNPDIECTYELPLIFDEQGLGEKILDKFGLKPRKNKFIELNNWRKYIEKIKNLKEKVRIAIVGKYFATGLFTLLDSYISVIEAINHAAWHNNVKPEIVWINSTDFEENPDKLNVLKNVDGIVVPGGFGKTGVEGKILAIKYAREKNIPFLGLCFGFQLAVVEFARNVCRLKHAHSTEIDPNTPHPVIDLLPEQIKLIKESKYGATMRLGAHTILIKRNTLAYKLYGRERVVERFRHRYEINPRYVDLLEQHGFLFSGTTPDGKIMQIGELPVHRFFIGTQFHPEFTSRFMKPNPLFDGFIKASKNYRKHVTSLK